jgi:hypothetical protein
MRRATPTPGLAGTAAITHLDTTGAPQAHAFPDVVDTGRRLARIGIAKP